MRAHGRKHEIGKRFAILVGVAATGVMALGAQTGAAASEDVVSYRSKVTIFRTTSGIWGGRIQTCSAIPRTPLTDCKPTGPRGARKCAVGREVIVFRKRPGPDRKLGADRSTLHWERGHLQGEWWVRAPARGRVYAKVTPKVGDGFVCRADYSHPLFNGSGRGDEPRL